MAQQRGPRMQGPFTPRPPAPPKRFGQNPHPPRWMQNQVEKRKGAPQNHHMGEMNKKKSKVENSEKLEILYRDVGEILARTHTENDAIIAVIKYIQPTQQQTHQLLERVTGDLKNVLSKCFPYFDIHPFGSAVTGLLMKDSDLDFYVYVPENMLANMELLMKEVEKFLWRSRIFTKIIKIPRARVPLLKFYHPALNVYCDVNFTNSMGLHSSGFIQHLIQFDFRIYPLMMVVKFWANTHELSGTGRITNYCLVMMVIYYLQTLRDVPILPPVATFQQNVPMRDVGGWNVAYSRDLRSTGQNFTPVTKLLANFFDFISSYDYDNSMMSPLFGRSYRKDAFAPAVEPPAEFELYRAHVANHPNDTFLFDRPLCVQDPFELKINIGACCGAKHLRKFINCAAYATRIFQEGELNREPLSKILMKVFFENPVTVPAQKNTQKCGNRVSPKIPGIDSKSVLTVTLMPSRVEMKILKSIVKQQQNLSEQEKKMISKFWVDTMGRFIISILREIYLLKLEVETQPGNSTTEADYPKVFLTSTQCNVWSGRNATKATSRELIEVEKVESQRLKSTLQPEDPIKFSLVLNTNHGYDYLQVSCIDRQLVRNNLKEFHNHFVTNVRGYLSGYLDNYRHISSNGGDVRPTTDRVIEVKVMKDLGN